MVKQASKKVGSKSGPKSAHKRTTPKPCTKNSAEKNPHKKSTQRSTHRCRHGGRDAQGCSPRGLPRDLTLTLGNDLRWAQQQVGGWNSPSLNTQEEVHTERRKTILSRLWRENPLSRNRLQKKSPRIDRRTQSCKRFRPLVNTFSIETAGISRSPRSSWASPDV